MVDRQKSRFNPALFIYDMIFNMEHKRKVNFKKLKEFGFLPMGKEYIYNADLFEGQFSLKVIVSAQGHLTTKVVDKSSEEPYTLHLLDGVSGSFVGKIKEEYDTILQNIYERCFEKDVFKSEYTKKVIEFARKEYGDELEFLWEKFSDNAVLRRKDTCKWYAAILTVAAEKFGLGGTEKVEVIDLRMPPEELLKLVDNKKYFPGYHMNKKHWLTIILNGSVPIKEIFERIRVSYELAKK